MEQFRTEQPDFSNEHLRSQEIIALEYRVMQKYFEIAGVPKHQIAEWVNQNGAALRQIADREPEFLYDFLEHEDATKETFEAKLQQHP